MKEHCKKCGYYLPEYLFEKISTDCDSKSFNIVYEAICPRCSLNKCVRKSLVID